MLFYFISIIVKVVYGEENTSPLLGGTQHNPDQRTRRRPWPAEAATPRGRAGETRRVSSAHGDGGAESSGAGCSAPSELFSSSKITSAAASLIIVLASREKRVIFFVSLSLHVKIRLGSVVGLRLQEIS